MASFVRPGGTHAGLSVRDKIRVMWARSGGYEDLGVVTAVTPEGVATHVRPVYMGVAEYERAVEWDPKWGRYQEV